MLLGPGIASNAYPPGDCQRLLRAGEQPGGCVPLACGMKAAGKPIPVRVPSKAAEGIPGCGRRFGEHPAMVYHGLSSPLRTADPCSSPKGWVGDPFSLNGSVSVVLIVQP